MTTATFSEPGDEITKEQLKEENEQFHKQITDLNSEMDQMLLRRDKNKFKKRIGGKATEQHSLEYRQAFARCEALRKERVRLQAEVAHSDTALAISETRNGIGLVEQQILQLRSEIKSLENMKKGQENVVDVAKHAEEELRFLYDEHRQELNVFRDRYRALQETVKADEKTLFMWQTKYHNADEKNKLGIDASGFEALKAKTDEQEAKIEQLKSHIDDLAQKSEGGRRKVDAKVIKNMQERQRLNRRIDLLRDLLKERDRELKLSYAVHRSEKHPMSA